MTTIEQLHHRLKAAIQSEHARRRDLIDYPGYWLLIIEKQLPRNDAQCICQSLGIDVHQRSAYKVKFCNALIQAQVAHRRTRR